MDTLLEYLLKAIAYALNATMHSVRVGASLQWPLAIATVTAPPTSSSGFGCPSVEIIYSYRLDGELYTGIHEEPFLLARSVSEYLERFGEGRNIVVRVKPDNPEVSIVCEGDQGALIQSQREQLTS
jgi:uncharacterized protein DUF3592